MSTPTLREQLAKTFGAYGSYLTSYNDHEGRFDPLDLEQATAQVLTLIKAELLKALPEKRPTAAPRGKIMPFNESCINDGFNAALTQITSVIEERLI